LEEEEEGLFKADAVNEEDPERDRATQEEEEEMVVAGLLTINKEKTHSEHTPPPPHPHAPAPRSLRQLCKNCPPPPPPPLGTIFKGPKPHPRRLSREPTQLSSKYLVLGNP
jgi:hypothetical protein